jgi:hypothetical protein
MLRLAPRQISGHQTRWMLDRHNIASTDDTREAMTRTTLYRKGAGGRGTDRDRVGEERDSPMSPVDSLLKNSRTMAVAACSLVYADWAQSLARARSSVG